MEQRNVSYSELSMLENRFDRITKDANFPNDEIRNECLLDYIEQFINGEEPQVHLSWQLQATS